MTTKQSDMNLLILAYDLKNVKPGDNQKVKAALVEKYTNTFTHLDSRNCLSIVPEWVRLKFPDTTIIVENATAPAAEVVAEAVQIIKSVKADPDAVFAAYIGENFLWNAKRTTLLAA